MVAQLAFQWLTKDGENPFTANVDKGIQEMTGNPNFTTLAAAVSATEASYNAYLIAKANAIGGGVDATRIRAARRGGLTDLLRPLLSNINAIANGDVEKLMSSGFPLRKTDRTPVGPLGTPQSPVVSQGPTTGSLKAFIPPVYGAALYTARLALASMPDKFVETQQSTGTRFLFEGLTPGELYNVEMNAIGAAGPSDWSDDGTMRVI